MKARWEAEREGVDAVKRIKGEIEQLGADIENAQMNLEYEKAAKLKYSDCPSCKRSSQRPRPPPRSAAPTTPWCTTPSPRRR